MPAANSIHVYPETAGASVGLASAFHSSVLVESTQTFGIATTMEEYTDANTLPDTLIYHSPKLTVAAQVHEKDNTANFLNYAPGAAFTLASLGLTTPTTGMFGGYTFSSAYLVLEPFERTREKGKLGSRTLTFRVHGFTTGSTLPSSGTYPNSASA